MDYERAWKELKAAIANYLSIKSVGTSLFEDCGSVKPLTMILMIMDGYEVLQKEEEEGNGL